MTLDAPAAGADAGALVGLDAAAAAALLGTDPACGLTADEAARRLASVGPNELGARAGTTRVELVRAQLRNPLLVVLSLGGAVSAATGHWIDAVAIMAVVAINATIGFLQEARADAALAALRGMSAPVATSCAPANGAVFLRATWCRAMSSG